MTTDTLRRAVGLSDFYFFLPAGRGSNQKFHYSLLSSIQLNELVPVSAVHKTKKPPRAAIAHSRPYIHPRICIYPQGSLSCFPKFFFLIHFLRINARCDATYGGKHGTAEKNPCRPARLPYSNNPQTVHWEKGATDESGPSDG